MWVNLNMNSNVLISIGIVIVLWICGKFGYDFYNKTRPDFKNIVYSTLSETNTLDIYTPKTWTAPYPVVVWIHGGKWQYGSKSNPRSLDRLLLEWFSVVSINYRLSDEVKWPAQLSDMEAVVRFLKLNSEKYKLNKDKIWVWGESAGAYLANMTNIGLVWNPETRIQASVSWYSPVDFGTMDEDMTKGWIESDEWKTSDSESPESLLLWKTVKDNLELAKWASLLSYISKIDVNTPPAHTMIMHGKLDPKVSYLQANKLKTGIQSRFWTEYAEYHILDQWAHWGGEFETKETEDKVILFLRKYLR
jgi:acetyl esterase/lipase